MPQSIFTELRSSYTFLTRVEKSIADWILEHPQRFIGMTMAELSGEISVSQGSLNNFARKFTDGGFADLKLRIAADLSSYAQIRTTAADGQAALTVMQQRIQLATESFATTLALNSEAALQEVAKLILSARRVEIYGIFHSAIVARDLFYQLLQLGISATFAEDTLIFAVSASSLSPQDLVIAVSTSGRTSDIIDAVKIAQENHTPVVCLTSNPFSPLAKRADHVLLSAPRDSANSYDFIGERLAQMLVIDTLCAHLRNIVTADQQHAFSRMQRIANSHAIAD